MEPIMRDTNIGHHRPPVIFLCLNNIIVLRDIKGSTTGDTVVVPNEIRIIAQGNFWIQNCDVIALLSVGGFSI
jgi:hypothetical protein